MNPRVCPTRVGKIRLPRNTAIPCAGLPHPRGEDPVGEVRQRKGRRNGWRSIRYRLSWVVRRLRIVGGWGVVTVLGDYADQTEESIPHLQIVREWVVAADGRGDRQHVVNGGVEQCQAL